MKNHHIYSDNFVLNVLDLSCADLATEEDKKYHIDDWAKLFKAATWEEIKKMSDKNEYLYEASKSIFLYNTDEQIQKLCRDRVEYYQDLRNYERFIDRQKAAICEKDNTIASLQAQVQKLIDENKKLKNTSQ